VVSVTIFAEPCPLRFTADFQCHSRAGTYVEAAIRNAEPATLRYALQDW
jgi:hypothetical protein